MDGPKVLLAGFVAIIVGLVLLGTVASSTYSATDGAGTQVNSESLNISTAYNGDSGFMNQTIMFSLANKGVQCYNGQGGWVSNSITIKNSSGTTLTAGNYTVDYTNNTIIFKNTTTTDPDSFGGSFFGGNLTSVTYQYWPTSYICESWERTITNLVPGFFALAILGVGIACCYIALKDML